MMDFYIIKDNQIKPSSPDRAALEFVGGLDEVVFDNLQKEVSLLIDFRLTTPLITGTVFRNYRLASWTFYFGLFRWRLLILGYVNESHQAAIRLDASLNLAWAKHFHHNISHFQA